MEIEALRKNFEDQLTQAEKQIEELEVNLLKAREYRTKLVGGMETLNLLEDKPAAEEKGPEEITENSPVEE
jgi:cellobiose-specific phosphotransferase system component IIA